MSRSPNHPDAAGALVVRAWRWGIALVVVVGFFGACPFLTGTIIPFLLVCVQILTILIVVALTSVVKVWQVLPYSLKLSVVLLLDFRLPANRQPDDTHQVQPVSVLPGEEWRYGQYKQQANLSYPEMMPPQE